MKPGDMCLGYKISYPLDRKELYIRKLSVTKEVCESSGQCTTRLRKLFLWGMILLLRYISMIIATTS
jgi:hypothetical protein